MPETADLQIRIKEINEVSFTFKPIPIPEEQVVFGKNLLYAIGLDIKLDLTTEIIKLKLLVNYSLADINDIILSLESEVVFHVINLKAVTKKEDNQKNININDEFLATLLGVCIGTSRGILSTKTKGTIIAKYPLPILNPNDILKQIKNNKNL
jgi:hypothetical protein